MGICNNELLLIEIVSFSYYEVYITSLRALTAMGFPYGADEDAAFMTTWLELYNLGGIQKLSEQSNQIDKQFNGIINLEDIKSKKSINLYKTSLLMKGPGLFDYLYEETKKKQNLEVILENCIDPIYIMPLSKKLSNKLESISAYWIENNKKIGIDISKNKMLIGESKNNTEILDGQVYLQFSINDTNKSSLKTNLDINNIKYEINDTIEQRQLKESLKPDPVHWNIISKFAHKTFVPATDVSRNRGAGGGDDND